MFGSFNSLCLQAFFKIPSFFFLFSKWFSILQVRRLIGDLCMFSGAPETMANNLDSIGSASLSDVSICCLD